MDGFHGPGSCIDPRQGCKGVLRLLAMQERPHLCLLTLCVRFLLQQALLVLWVGPDLTLDPLQKSVRRLRFRRPLAIVVVVVLLRVLAKVGVETKNWAAVFRDKPSGFSLYTAAWQLPFSRVQCPPA